MKRKKPVIAITIEIILAIAIMSGLLLSVFMVLDERKGELNPAKAQGEVLGDDTISGDESTEVIQEFLETDFAPDGSDNYGTDGETAGEDMDSMSDGEGVNIEDNEEFFEDNASDLTLIYNCKDDALIQQYSHCLYLLLHCYEVFQV